MFSEIEDIEDGSGRFAIEECKRTLHLILRGKVDLSDVQLFNVWEITGVYICKIYRKILKSREGIG